MRPDIDFAVEVLSKLSEPTIDERVRNGQRIRAQIIAAAERGEKLTSYRWDWLRNSAKQMVELLAIMAEDFNKAHPDDFCTYLDLLDILGLTDDSIRDVAGLPSKKK